MTLYKPQGNTSTENNKCTKWGMVVKGLTQNPEKDDVQQHGQKCPDLWGRNLEFIWG